MNERKTVDLEDGWSHMQVCVFGALCPYSMYLFGLQTLNGAPAGTQALHSKCCVVGDYQAEEAFRGGRGVFLQR